MSNTLTVACIQTNAATEVAINLERIEPMIRTARERGAQLITLPENINFMVSGREKIFARVSKEDEDPAVAFFARMAKEAKAWILAGSILIFDGSQKLFNRSYVFDATGKIVARYDKIHLFDADVGEKESYRESANFHHGDRAVTADTPWGKIGLTICYDVRFPHLFRALAKAGATIITVPAAFTYTTGKAHWHVLLRARAIETGCFIVAPAQCGEHDGGRRTYGHSLIIAPWGDIIAEGEETTPGILLADLDLTQVTDARRRLPSLTHDRKFEKL